MHTENEEKREAYIIEDMEQPNLIPQNPVVKMISSELEQTAKLQ